MFRLEHYDDMFQPEHSAICSNRNTHREVASMFQSEHSAHFSPRAHRFNVPTGTLGWSYPDPIDRVETLAECSDWNTGRVLHTISTCVWLFDLAFETLTALFCQQLWLLDNLWDASSLLPIRRAAWGRLRLPST